jgi:hypothetical protein
MHIGAEGLDSHQQARAWALKIPMGVCRMVLVMDSSGLWTEKVREAYLAVMSFKWNG